MLNTDQYQVAVAKKDAKPNVKRGTEKKALEDENEEEKEKPNAKREEAKRENKIEYKLIKYITLYLINDIITRRDNRANIILCARFS